jgi:hypothetical protein
MMLRARASDAFVQVELAECGNSKVHNGNTLKQQYDEYQQVNV